LHIGNRKEQYFEVRRSTFSLVVGFVLAEVVLLFLLFLVVYTYLDTVENPKIRESLHFPSAVFTFFLMAVYLHCLLIIGSFYRLITVSGERIELRRFLRKTKTFSFSDIERLVENLTPLHKRYRLFGLKIIGKNDKVITYLKLNDRNYELFVATCLKHNIENNITRLKE
jgi:hypothetical protein